MDEGKLVKILIIGKMTHLKHKLKFFFLLKKGTMTTCSKISNKIVIMKNVSTKKQK